jgi:hypothetical protein
MAAPARRVGVTIPRTGLPGALRRRLHLSLPAMLPDGLGHAQGHTERRALVLRPDGVGWFADWGEGGRKERPPSHWLLLSERSERGSHLRCE